ncbi:MAG: hypothetical protein E7675_04985 [Ruminococcaceae bacterium]|nr:hypothetical protein [Oscillospiraceae bacterium]
MKKKKETLVEKYFRQTKGLVFDVTAVLLVAFGLLIHIFGFKISFLGIPMIFAGAIVKITDLFIIIKDKEFDDYMADLKERNIVIYPGEQPDLIMEIYDLNEGPIKIGRDQDPRSNIYSFTTFTVQDKFCNIENYKINALKGEVSHDTYKVPLSTEYEINKLPSLCPKRYMSYLTLKGDEALKIPVKNDSYDLEVYMKNFN